MIGTAEEPETNSRCPAELGGQSRSPCLTTPTLRAPDRGPPFLTGFGLGRIGV